MNEMDSINFRRLNLPDYPMQIRRSNQQLQIFDKLRKRFVALSPEEWVRQHMINFLIHHVDYSPGRMACEYTLRINGMNKRADIVVFNKHGIPSLLVECKAPEIILNQKVFDQAARYNLQLMVPFLVITNGMQIKAAYVDLEKRAIEPIKQLPPIDELDLIKG